MPEGMRRDVGISVFSDYDGSSDYAREILDELEKGYERVWVIHHDGNDFPLSESLPPIPQLR